MDVFGTQTIDPGRSHCFSTNQITRQNRPRQLARSLGPRFLGVSQIGMPAFGLIPASLVCCTVGSRRGGVPLPAANHFGPPFPRIASLHHSKSNTPSDTKISGDALTGRSTQGYQILVSLLAGVLRSCCATSPTAHKMNTGPRQDLCWSVCNTRSGELKPRSTGYVYHGTGIKDRDGQHSASEIGAITTRGSGSAASIPVPILVPPSSGPRLRLPGLARRTRDCRVYLMPLGSHHESG
jgi:hypothetical protein